MATARNEVTGRVVSGDEATLRRLGPRWLVDDDKPRAQRKVAAKPEGESPAKSDKK